MASIEIDEAAVDLSVVLPFCWQQLGLQGLACLATSSKQLSDACISTARRYALSLLLDTLQGGEAVESVTAAAPDLPQQNAVEQHLCTQAVSWLLYTAPAVATAAAGAADRLVHMPEVPFDCALQLVAVGVCFSCAQLLEAAHSMVAGVEVWVQAQQQLGLHTDIPAEAVDLCCDVISIYQLVSQIGSC
jgi:hypothetical protein